MFWIINEGALGRDDVSGAEERDKRVYPQLLFLKSLVLPSLLLPVEHGWSKARALLAR